MQAYINTCNIRADGTKDSFLTVSVPVVHEPMPHHKLGLSYTATGYGKRIPTEYKVKYNGQWRRVYCCIFSNVGTTYIGKLSDSIIVNLDN